MSKVGIIRLYYSTHNYTRASGGMVYTKDLKSFPFIAVVGSSPTSPTNHIPTLLVGFYFLFPNANNEELIKSKVSL